MKKVSRRELARTVTRQLLEGKDPATVMRQLAAYLIDNKMTNQSGMLIDDIAIALQSQTGHVTAEIVAAFSPAADMKKRLESFVAQQTQAQSVELTVTTDKSLVGGMVVKTPGHEYDASVRRKLNLLARGEA